MDYSDLQTRVRRRIFVNTDDPILTLTDEYVNEALHMLETSAPDGWPWMRQEVTVTLTSGTAAYAFSTIGVAATPDVTVSKILTVKVLSNGNVYYPLEFRTIDEANQLYADVSRTGLPESYSVDAQTLTVYPTPDAAYTLKVRIVYTEADLSYNTQTPALPAVFHAAIVDAATMLMYESMQDPNRADVYAKRVDNWVEKMRRYGNESEASPKIRVRDWL